MWVRAAPTSSNVYLSLSDGSNMNLQNEVELGKIASLRAAA
jgi:hypothetical protein